MKKKNKQKDNKKKETKKQFQIRFLKIDLEHKKEVYNTYLEVLIEYSIPSVAYSAIMVQENLNNALMRKFKEVRNNPKIAMNLLFGDGKKLNEKEILERGIKYYGELINLIVCRINNFEHKTKLKIVKDAMEKEHAWLYMDRKCRKEGESK